jgi:hypothetical protein
MVSDVDVNKTESFPAESYDGYSMIRISLSQDGGAAPPLSTSGAWLQSIGNYTMDICDEHCADFGRT